MHAITVRQSALLEAVVREYIRTAEPIASERLANRAQVSPATVRSDMAALEAAGFLRQPHTSAGRVPTEAGFKFFIDHCLREEGSRKTHEPVARHSRQQEEGVLRDVARELAATTGEAVVLALSPTSMFVTGLGGLAKQPEFQDLEQMVRMTYVLDHLEDMMAGLFDTVGEDLEIRLGSENPFGEDFGTVLMKIELAPRHPRLLGLIGPMRMDYERSCDIMRSLLHTLQNS